jgi:hypothetical protein
LTNDSFWRSNLGMKILPVLVAVLGMASAASAQTNSAAYVPRADDLRIVDGKMFNRVLSTNWTSLPAMGAVLEVVDTVPEGVVFQSKTREGKPGDKVLVKHHPAEKGLTKGKTMKTPFRALKVADFKYGKETLAAYDCGLANTAENRQALKNGPIHAEK